jgi:predicted Zn-dependent peptidase
MKRRFIPILALLLVFLLFTVSVSSLLAQTQAKPQAAPAKAKTAVPAEKPKSPAATKSAIPASPKDLKYAPLTYTPPKAEKYRHVLSSGAIAYLVEDHDLPLVNVAVIVKTGGYLVPADKLGVGGLTGSQMRAGGTASMTAEQFDEAADFLAADIKSNMGETSAGASLNCLTKDTDKGLALFFDMLKNPGFQAERLTLAKSQMLQNLERRNDSTDSIENREWTRLIRGTDHFSSRQSTKATIESITRDDLIAFHKKYYHPDGFIFAVSGDFKTDEMIQKLEAALKGWEKRAELVPDVPKPTTSPVPGIYMVNKSDVNQGRVAIGHLGSMRDNPDSYALSIMSDILGGGGFTSRIMTRVRSDEGLAYSAGAHYGFGVYYPGVFTAEFQSKSSTCAQAAQIVIDEIDRIRKEKVTAEELETSKNQAIEVFPRYFATAGQIAGTFAEDEYTHRPANYWDTYRERIKNVTADDVLRVAQKYLEPDKLVVLMVGNVDDMLKGSPDKPQYAVTKLSKDSQIHRIPLPDPVTMVYPKAQ